MGGARRAETEAGDRAAEIVPLVHFVGFRDDRYWNAVRVFGPPDVVHRNWDPYAAGDVAPCDTVVHATGEWSRAPRSFSMEAERNRRARRGTRQADDRLPGKGEN